jgi:nucleotide-binding universal stress UspA family protein
LIVLLDEMPPLQGAFIHALEWAWYLRLPIHAWALAELDASQNSPNPVEAWDAVSRARLPATAVPDSFVAKVNGCVRVCGEWGVKFGLTQIEGIVSQWFEQNLRPDDLLILSPAPARTGRLALVRQVLHQSAAVLLCPKDWRSTLSRMLVLYRSGEQNQHSLVTAMELCRCVRATPVVLTVARSQREGYRLQQPARAAFAEQGQCGNFDLVIGADVAEAAARVARWRQCQLLVMGRYGRLRWTHWLDGSTTDRLIGLADSLAILTIPKREVFSLGEDPGTTAMTLVERLPGRVSEQRVGGT